MPSQVSTSSRLRLPSIRLLRARIRSATTTILAIAVVGVAVLLAAWINAQARMTAQRMSHSIEIRERAERFLGHMRDAETGQRGYLLTSDEKLLVPFKNGMASALPELEALGRLVEGDPEQAALVAQARVQTQVKLRDLEANVELVRNALQSEAVARMISGVGAQAMESLRNIVQQIQLAENARLVKLNRSEERRRVLASVGIVVALAGLAFAAWLQLQARQRRTASLADSNAELERMVEARTQQLESERLRIEALLRDVNHRVGNNLAMVSALLNVQSRQAQEPAVRLALAQAQSRIQAIAAGQRRLRLDLETDEIDARPYMEDLIDEISKAAEGRPIKIELDIDSIRLPGRDAVSFVVIVNELVTNAIKHAFPDGMPGRVVVRLSEIEREGEPHLALIVEDDGVGMAGEVERKGLGQTVIASLLRSMRATMTSAVRDPASDRPGCRVELVFPKRD